MLEEYLVDQSTVPWRGLKKEGLPDSAITKVRWLLDGSDGGPEAINTRHPEGYGSEAHFHLGAQFQVLIHGSIHFANLRLDAVAVHYTDHCVAYGPFTSTNEEDLFVLHARRANVIQSKDHVRARQHVNRAGREIIAMVGEHPWEPVPGQAGARCKLLIPRAEGPSAEIVECPAGVEINSDIPQFGRYEIVLAGSVIAGDRVLGPRSLRFVRGDESLAGLRAGPEGATLIVLTFDADAAWVPPPQLNAGFNHADLPVVAQA